MPELVGVGCHEFDANWVFEYDVDGKQHSGLQPYDLLDTITGRNEGMVRTKTKYDGHEYSIRLNVEESGIGALNYPTVDLDIIDEYRITWERLDDVGQCSGSFHIAPRTPDMETEDGEEINSPDIVGVNVRAQGSNLDFDTYLPLFRKCMQALNVSRRYWRDKHLHTDKYSNIQDGEVYVRIHKDVAGQYISVDGAIARISNLCSGDRSGYTKHVRDDRGKDNRFYHTATIGDFRAGELIESHQFAKEVKCYTVKDPDKFDEDDVLAHPKLGVSLQSSKSDDTIYWAELDAFWREIDELLLNALNWEGLPVTAEAIAAEGSPYIESDEYFDPQPYHRNRRLKDDPTPQIKDTQDTILYRHLADGLEESDEDVLAYMTMADGGQIAPKDVAEETGWHYETVLSAIKRLEGLVEHRYGDLQLRSHHIAEQVSAAVQEARDGVRDAFKSLEERIRQSTTKEVVHSALTAWVDQHGVEIVEDRDDARYKLRMGSFESKTDAAIALLHGLDAWEKAGWPREEFVNALACFDVHGSRWELTARHVMHPQRTVRA